MAWAIPYTEAGSWWRVVFVLWAGMTAHQALKLRPVAIPCGATALACVLVPMFWGANQPGPLISSQGMAEPALWAMLVWLCGSAIWLGFGHGAGAMAMAVIGILYGVHWLLPLTPILIGVELILLLLLLAVWGKPGGKFISNDWRLRTMGILAGSTHSSLCRRVEPPKGPEKCPMTSAPPGAGKAIFRLGWPRLSDPQAAFLTESQSLNHDRV